MPDVFLDVLQPVLPPTPHGGGMQSSSSAVTGVPAVASGPVIDG